MSTAAAQQNCATWSLGHRHRHAHTHGVRTAHGARTHLAHGCKGMPGMHAGPTPGTQAQARACTPTHARVHFVRTRAHGRAPTNTRANVRAHTRHALKHAR
eukprot:14713842-Alexandrium_andersonii.AAC.1